MTLFDAITLTFGTAGTGGFAVTNSGLAGSLKDTGVVPITNIMLIIGEQSTGKSTFMKVLSFCRWIEKKAMLGEYDDIVVNGGFIKQLKEFHKLSDEYFKNGEPFVEYTSDVVSISHKGINTKTKVSKIEDNKRHNTKIAYIPAERNLLSVIPNLDNKYKASSFDSMFNCAMEFSEANAVFTKKNPLKLVFADDDGLFLFSSRLGRGFCHRIGYDACQRLVGIFLHDIG